MGGVFPDRILAIRKDIVATMKVLLLNVDSKLPNIALKKIELWHRLQGDEITWDMPIMLEKSDQSYASCIFTKNRAVIENYKGLYPKLVAGGTGWDLSIKLPPEIDAMKARINYGFTTRGCIRKCPFCFVPVAEGEIRAVGDIYDIWDGESPVITLLDNNILALPSHFKKICEQIQREKLIVDFNQGLDIRLMTEELACVLKATKTSDIRFAFDNPALESIIRSKIEMLREVAGFGRKAFFFYVLVGFDTTFEQDLHRLNVLRELGCRAYVMRYENTPNGLRYIELAEWANQMWTFAKYDFATFCKEREAR
jgi:hypothetical protein